VNDPDELLDINCGRCGTPLKIRLGDLGDARFVECEPCAARPPFNSRQVFVVFEQRRTDYAGRVLIAERRGGRLQ
jgi:hypothetical protein